VRQIGARKRERRGARGRERVQDKFENGNQPADHREEN